MKKASRATVVKQTKKATWVQIASELRLDTRGTKEELVSRIEKAMTVIPAHVSDESRVVLQRLGYDVAVQESDDLLETIKYFSKKSPEPVEPESDLLEIRPMRIAENDNQKEVVEPCDKEIAEFYALYLNLPYGTQEWISDHDTLEDATHKFKELKESGRLGEMLDAFEDTILILSEFEYYPYSATQVRSMGNIAIRLQYFGLTREALKLYLKVLDKIDEVDDAQWQATQFWGLGTTCNALGKQDMATQYIAEAIDRGSIVDDEGKLVIWQHILDVWKDELRRLYSEQDNLSTCNC